jgi:hypothetical protein
MNEKEILTIIIIIFAIIIFIKLWRVLAFFVFAAAIAIGYFYFFERDRINIPKITDFNKSPYQGPAPIINPSPQALPDFTVSWDLKPPVKRLPCNEPFYVAGIVTNYGSAIAHNIEVKLNDGHQYYFIQSLLPNDRTRILIEIKPDIIVNRTGLRYFNFYWEVDPENQIKEIDENNNRSSQFYFECF